MADDVNINEGTGVTVPVAADEIGGVKHQRVKVQFGADGSATDVSSAAPLPVAVASVAIPATFYHGQTVVAAAGTEVALVAISQALLSGVTVKALAGNTGLIYVGKDPVSASTGFELAAGESVFIEISNLATVFIDSSVNGEGVSYIAS